MTDFKQFWKREITKAQVVWLCNFCGKEEVTSGVYNEKICPKCGHKMEKLLEED